MNRGLWVMNTLYLGGRRGGGGHETSHQGGREQGSSH